MLYGKSDHGNLAVAFEKTEGLWDAVEVDCDRYHIVAYESLNEEEMAWADELESYIS